VSELVRLREDVDELEGQVEQLKADVHSTKKDAPGLSLRLDRVERFLDAGWKLMLSAGGVAVVWRFADAVVAFLARGP
jgi:hypothetical protein